MLSFRVAVLGFRAYLAKRFRIWSLWLGTSPSLLLLLY